MQYEIKKIQNLMRTQIEQVLDLDRSLTVLELLKGNLKYKNRDNLESIKGKLADIQHIFTTAEDGVCDLAFRACRNDVMNNVEGICGIENENGSYTVFFGNVKEGRIVSFHLTELQKYEYFVETLKLHKP